jgi:hypothetical protein
VKELFLVYRHPASIKQLNMTELFLDYSPHPLLVTEHDRANSWTTDPYHHM